MTGIRATNWPTRDRARVNAVSDSTKGHDVASRRTYEIRRVRAVRAKMDDLLVRAERHFRRVKFDK